MFGNAPYVEYAVHLKQRKYAPVIKCLPTQSISIKKNWKQGISWNGSPIEKINLHAESKSRQWKENVLKGFTETKSSFSTSKESNALRVYFQQVELALSALDIE